MGKNSRADPLVKGFAEEERDERSRKKRAMAAAMSVWGTKQDGEYRFNSIKAEFKYHTPTPYDAERLLEKLATDPGIIEIMKTRQFKVGILTEMSPVEAQDRMAKEGMPNMDLLGYNQNYGEKIVLRLRTDTLKGFRPYHDIMNTLIHELTHNVWGPHDHNFWKLFGELKAQYMRFHKFWSSGGHTADSNATAQFGGFAEGLDDESNQASGFGRSLGTAGASQDDSSMMATLTVADHRARVLAACEKRTGPRPFSTFTCGCGLDHDAISLCRPIGSSSDVVLTPRQGALCVDKDSNNSGSSAIDSLQVATSEPVESRAASSEKQEGTGHLSAEDSEALRVADVWMEQFSTHLQTLCAQMEQYGFC